MVKKIGLIFLLNTVSLTGKSQCTITGGMGVYNACNNGQGCTAGCNLTAFNPYGPMCNGTGVTGNCFGLANGQQNMSTSYIIPAGCTANVTAEYKKRGGTCTNSGMDGGDLIGINNTMAAGTNVGNCGGGTSTPGVTAGGCQGAANADVLVTRTQTGGTITIWGAANRSDEIITFTLSFSGTCGAGCSGVLPIEIINYWGEVNDKSIDVKWLLSTQRNVDHFTIEKSIDGINYDSLGKVPAINFSAGEKMDYSFSDPNPVKGINYYRLNNIDIDGSRGEYKILAVNYKIKEETIWTEQNEDNIIIHLNRSLKNASIQLIYITGSFFRQFNSNEINLGIITIEKSQIPKGLYILKALSGENISNPKIIVY